MADKQGTVKLNGKYYRIDLQGYRGRDVTDFAPRASTPGGGMTFSEMNIYQPLNITDWKHGFGFAWHTDASGYMYTAGNVDTRQSGLACLFPVSALKATVSEVMSGLALAHNGQIVAYGAKGAGTNSAYKLAAGGGYAATAIATISAVTKINFMFSNGTYTFALIDGARVKESHDATLATWADTGAAGAVDFKWMVAHNGFFYLGKDGTNEVYYASAIDLSDLQDPTDPGVIYVGPKGRSVTGAISYNGELIFFRPDGLYKMSADRKTASKILDYSDVVNNDNFSNFSVYNGALYFNVRDRVVQWNGVRIVDITPSKITDTYPYLMYGKFNAMFTLGRFMYVVAQYTVGSNTWTDFICWDGVGWTKLAPLLTAGANTDLVPDMIYDQTDKGFVFLYTAATPSSKIYSFTYNEVNEIPTTGLPVTGTHAIYSSRMDAGFRRVIKSTPSILIEASNLSAVGGSERNLKVYYSIDGGASTPWGGTDGVTNLISISGVTTLTNPLGISAGKSSIEYYYLQIIIYLSTAVATQSPILEGLTVRLIMRPNTGYGYAFPILAAENVDYAVGQGDDRTPFQILTDVRAARDSKKWVEFVDPYGQSHNVYVTSVSEIAVEEHSDETGPTPNIEQQIQVNLIEVP